MGGKSARAINERVSTQRKVLGFVKSVKVAVAACYALLTVAVTERRSASAQQMSERECLKYSKISSFLKLCCEQQEMRGKREKKEKKNWQIGL
jgi:hypothetical protein